MNTHKHPLFSKAQLLELCSRELMKTNPRIGLVQKILSNLLSVI